MILPRVEAFLNIHTLKFKRAEFLLTRFVDCAMTLLKQSTLLIVRTRRCQWRVKKILTPLFTKVF